MTTRRIDGEDSISEEILSPCRRSGESADWWTEQHKACTGSWHAPGGLIACSCECHKDNGQKKGA